MLFVQHISIPSSLQHLPVINCFEGIEKHFSGADTETEVQYASHWSPELQGMDEWTSECVMISVAWIHMHSLTGDV